MNKTESLVKQFQCPGCVCGMDTECGSYKYDEKEKRCTGHVLGTFMFPGGHIALGLPKGFCKSGFNIETKESSNKMSIRLWESGTAPDWDRLNVPVWAMEEGGYLFVRTYAPRINFTWVDVVEGGKFSDVPNAINVGEFKDEID